MSGAITSQTFRASRRDALESTIEQLRSHLVGTLHPAHSGLPRSTGLQVCVAGDQVVRWFTSPAEGVLLLEVSSRDAAADFEIFVVPHQDGELRAGWRRRWAVDADPPLAWTVVSDVLSLEGRVDPRADPDFSVLLAALCSGAVPAIAYADYDARVALSADILHLRDIVDRQAVQLRKLQFAAAAARPVEPLVDTAPGPIGRQWRLVDLAEWADLHADIITVLPRAIAESKKSDLENQQLAFDALDLLANTYRLVKLSEISRDELKSRADQLGLFIGGSVSFPGEHGDAYYVMHRGRRRLLDQHLGRGSSRDSRFSLRIYFFWDDETRRAVVGWLPSHLPNSMT